MFFTSFSSRFRQHGGASSALGLDALKSKTFQKPGSNYLENVEKIKYGYDESFVRRLNEDYSKYTKKIDQKNGIDSGSSNSNKKSNYSVTSNCSSSNNNNVIMSVHDVIFINLKRLRCLSLALLLLSLLSFL